MNVLGGLGRDFRYAVRSLSRDRGSVALAVAALSLGIGATTLIFSVVYSVLLNAFPFRDQSRVVHFYPQSSQARGSWWYTTREFLDYKAQNHVFSDVLGGASLEVLYTLGDATYRVRGAIIDPHALPALGLKPILGREITDADGAREAPPTFLMSDRMWNERFNRDPHVIGTTLKLNGITRTLIAITPPRFMLHNADVFFPTTITPALTATLVGGTDGFPLSVWTYARLKDGVTLEQASADLEVIARREQQLYPEEYPKGDLKVTVLSLADAYTAKNLKEMVYILAGTVLMLLLIACSNVANLLLARATARETEMAVRASLGASRGHLMRQLLAESFVLAATGTAVGGFLAYAGLQWVRASIPLNALPAEIDIRFSTEALLGTIGVTLLTTVVCGIAPAVRAARGDLQRRLTGTGKGVGLRVGHGRLRTVLVAVQFTLAIVLLVAAGMMVRTLVSLERVELGLNPRNVVVGRFSFPIQQRRTPAGHRQFLQKVVEAVATVPGVAAVSPAIGFPLEPGPRTNVAIPGTADARRIVTLEYVSSGYFQAVGLPLVRGRMISEADVTSARKVAVVNRRFVGDFLAGADPTGRVVNFAQMKSAFPDEQPLFEIVGVVGDTRNSGVENDIQPQIFVPYTTPGYDATALVIRTNVEPLSIQQAVRRKIWDVNRDVALMGTMSLEDVLNRDSLSAPKFGVGLLSTFAILGLVLSSIGVFSVMAYTVSLQTHQIGIRMALGAQRADVMRMIALQGLRPVVVGIVAGFGASYAFRRVMEHQIHGITVNDPWTFAAVVAVLMIVGAAACLIPAGRATRIDPLVALRSE